MFSGFSFATVSRIRDLISSLVCCVFNVSRPAVCFAGPWVLCFIVVGLLLRLAFWLYCGGVCFRLNLGGFSWIWRFSRFFCVLVRLFFLVRLGVLGLGFCIPLGILCLSLLV